MKKNVRIKDILQTFLPRTYIFPLYRETRRGQSITLSKRSTKWLAYRKTFRFHMSMGVIRATERRGHMKGVSHVHNGTIVDKALN